MRIKVEFSKEYIKKLLKIEKKDRTLFNQIRKKSAEIIKNPQHYKPLKNVFSGYRRVHIGGGSYVIIYVFRDETIRFIKLEHHDKVYL